MAVPLMNPRAQYDHLTDAINERLAEIVDSGRFIFGPHVEAFEQEAAAYLGVRHAIGVANGTDALVISLRALGVGPGDEVICPSYTFYASCETIAAVGATPVFAEIDPATYTLDPESVRARLSGRTKAIMPVHLFGQCADMPALRTIASEAGVPLIEDAAQAFGSTSSAGRAGSLGDAATFSFFPTKNLPCLGDGGMIATDRDDVAELARMLRFHGSKDKKVFTHVGYNSRLDALQAGVLRLFLPELDGWNDARQQVRDWYEEEGLGELVRMPAVAPGNNHIYHVFMVASERRDDILAACRERDVSAAVYYDPPSHLQPVFEHLGWNAGDLPVSERMGREGLALPMFPTMTRDQVREVVQAVRAAVPTGVTA